MDDLLSEKEQIELIRTWWKEYGAYVIGGIVIGVGILIGMNYYGKSKLATQLEASSRYEALAQHIVDGDIDGAEPVAAQIVAEHADTAYAAQAGLAMARLYMDYSRDQDAADSLLAVVEGDAGDEIRNLARLRLARIYLYQDKAQEAVDLLDGNEDSGFAPVFGEVLGDAYTALGQVADAEAAYRAVLADSTAQQMVNTSLVQWKLLDLPEAETPAPAEETAETEDATDEEAE